MLSNLGGLLSKPDLEAHNSEIKTKTSPFSPNPGGTSPSTSAKTYSSSIEPIALDMIRREDEWARQFKKRRRGRGCDAGSSKYHMNQNSAWTDNENHLNRLSLLEVTLRLPT